MHRIILALLIAVFLLWAIMTIAYPDFARGAAAAVLSKTALRNVGVVITLTALLVLVHRLK